MEKLRYHLHRAAKPGHLMKIQQSQKDKTGEKEEIDVPHPPLSSLLHPYFLISLPTAPTTNCYGPQPLLTLQQLAHLYPRDPPP